MSEIDLKQSIHIIPITDQHEEEARLLILEGLKERFGFLDPSYNSDLTNIIQNYSQKGDLFLVGLHNNTMVCTTRETSKTGRIQRMSVKKSYRSAGLAKLMIQTLETSASKAGYERIVLETNNDWHSAIEFYKNYGYQLERKDEERSYFSKQVQA
ncbi:GNAT family N-acetyltransferase [Planococcus wigleyi]|uniref:Probable N-acetyltransferase 14 n=1 Tax=Planococcus wigleyi TaxID=2762216 RepID=A0ABR8WF39_9BACL|nr:GNAT family N-acetyltransferase [Planococcus wigleyi]MBD8015508.1 GNAT family N-acetyltransferase [Planococcus wigleyi]